MTRIFIATLLWMLASSALADCQDNCTAGEAICVEKCSNTGYAGLTCVTKCSNTATKCARSCTPEPKPPPDPSRQITGKWSWNSAFPLETGNDGLDVSSCCSVGIAPVTGKPKRITSPACAYVLCAPPETKAERTWSGKLFDFEQGPRPKNIFEQCSKTPGKLCSLLKEASIGDNPTDPSPEVRKQFRLQLEAFRQSTDFARTTGQITSVEHKQFMDSYKKDYRNMFGSK